MGTDIRAGTGLLWKEGITSGAYQHSLGFRATTGNPRSLCFTETIKRMMKL
jgi:hypothetical protein